MKAIFSYFNFGITASLFVRCDDSLFWALHPQEKWRPVVNLFYSFNQPESQLSFGQGNKKSRLRGIFHEGGATWN